MAFVQLDFVSVESLENTIACVREVLKYEMIIRIRDNWLTRLAEWFR